MNGVFAVPGLPFTYEVRLNNGERGRFVQQSIVYRVDFSRQAAKLHFLHLPGLHKENLWKGE
jgi:hypothetical protein